MFSKSQLRCLRKTARRLQTEAGSDSPIARTKLFNVFFINGQLVTGRLKHYCDDAACTDGYQARDGGHYHYGERMSLGCEYDPSGFERLFERVPGEQVFREASIGPWAKDQKGKACTPGNCG